MNGRELIRSILIIVASIFAFLSLQVYTKNYIDAYPWIFFIVSILLIMYADKIAEKITG